MKKKLAYIALNSVLLLSVAVLFINTQALGDKIAFESRRRNHTEIYVMDENGRNQQPLIREIDEPQDADLHPAWSPNGRWIVFQRRLWGLRDTEIFVMGTDGNNQRRLTKENVFDKHPAWFSNARYPVSPGGKLSAIWGWLKQKSE